MCAVYLACSWYRRANGDPAVNLVKAMSGKKTAFVALLGTAVLGQVLAVNGKERMLPSPNAVPYLFASAVGYVIAVAVSISQSNRTNSRQTAGKTASVKSGIIALLLVFLAFTQSAHCPTLLAQAFVFAIPAAALYIQSADSSEPLSASISRNPSAVALTALGENVSDKQGPGDIEAPSTEESAVGSILGRLQPRNERVRLTAVAFVLVPVLVWLGRHGWVLMGAAAEETMSVRGYGWKREADYDM